MRYLSAFVLLVVCAATAAASEPRLVTFESLKPGVYMLRPYPEQAPRRDDVFKAYVLAPDYQTTDPGFLLSAFAKDYPALKINGPKPADTSKLAANSCIVKHEDGSATWYTVWRALKGHTFPVPTY